MRVPENICLEEWIRQLIKDNQIVKFYKTDDWRELRAEVLREHNHECQRCLEIGRYTRAVMVHHVNEVRHVPRLALSKTFTDKDGNEKPNLLALCNNCHEAIHDRLQTWQKETYPKFENTERW